MAPQNMENGALAQAPCNFCGIGKSLFFPLLSSSPLSFRSPTWLQDGPRMARGCPKMAPEWLQGNPKLSQDGPDRPQVRPKRVQEGTGRPRDDPRWSENCRTLPKVAREMALNSSKMAQRCPKKAQMALNSPKIAQPCPKKAQFHPKR